MICALFKRELKSICRSVVRYIDISVSRAMGCFFGCFRIRDDHHRRPPNLVVSDSTRSLPPGAVVSKNRLSSLFLTEEREDLEWNKRKSDCFGSPQINKELANEAKFLKACGTLPETPSEIRKASEKLRVSPPAGKNSQSSDFHSWLPSTSIKKLQLDKEIDQPPTPVKLCEEWGHGSVSSEQTPSSCISNAQNTARMSVSSVEDATNVPFKNKSVRFECNLDTSSSESGHLNMRKFESPEDMIVSKPSPKPTPLKISDEMQTPGTVFPASLEILANGKTRIRSQYVHPLLKPVENASQWKVLQEDDSSSHQGLSELKGSLEQLKDSTPKSEVGVKDTSAPETKVEASLSSWLKPPQSPHKDDGLNDGYAASKNFRAGRTPMDRPIIGMVAAHWNENEPSQISPKWWDGNGIPNSTNKYKEDQKVSWHATPFEERLEKALSEESFISQKKPINGRPIVFDEHDESDTALSKLQASTHSKSVVSF
ncbi:protein JASON isoform X2 [Ricinus communis]|uniref:protein JASON isoform X2 n=1 Tax=Ricinus communis TaxID=3988 RepID=UPI00201A3466|nr:protein JASON isoform X2 [Ricinus communis]